MGKSITHFFEILKKLVLLHVYRLGPKAQQTSSNLCECFAKFVYVLLLQRKVGIFCPYLGASAHQNALWKAEWNATLTVPHSEKAQP
jgi:hypothetical protein